MTDADLHQIAWKIAAENPIPATDDLAASIATALTEAHTAGFNEAKERAVEIARNYGDSDRNDDLNNEPPEVTLGIETASSHIAFGIQGITPAGRRALEEGTGR